MSHITSRTLAAVAALFPALLLAPVSATAETGPEEAQGAQLLQSLQQSERGCSDLSDSEFKLIGESAMGRTVGSPRAHKAMNRLMVAMMGSSGEVQMHEHMGRRASGCAGGAVPSGFGRMMGMMKMMGGYQGAGGAGAGMMRGQSGTGSGAHGGSMMRGNPASAQDSDDDGPSAGVMIGLMAVLIAAMAIALLILKPWRQSGSSLELLDRRFASVVGHLRLRKASPEPSPELPRTQRNSTPPQARNDNWEHQAGRLARNS